MRNDIETGNLKNGLIFISGPSNSGKSCWGEYLIEKNRKVTYVATSKIYSDDNSWLKRIAKHKKRRPKCWKTVECDQDLIEKIEDIHPENALLIDSLGGYISNTLHISQDQWNNKTKTLIKILKSRSINSIIIVVSEEISWGIVPSTKTGFIFRERLSILARDIAKISNIQWLVVQGRAINLTSISYIVP